MFKAHFRVVKLAIISDIGKFFLTFIMLFHKVNHISGLLLSDDFYDATVLPDRSNALNSQGISIHLPFNQG